MGFESLLDAAREAYRAGRLREAASILESALSRFGSCVVLNSRLADVYVELGDLVRARAYELEAVRLDLNSHRGHYNLGCDYRDRGRVPEARDCFQTAIRLDSGYAKAYCNLAELTNHPKQALALLRKAASIDPEDEDYKRGISMWEPLAEAERIDWAPQRVLWAQQALENKEFRYARLHIRLAQEAAASPIQKAMVYSCESDLHRKEGDVRASIASLEQAVLRDPSRAFYWNNLAARRLLLAREPETCRDGAEAIALRSKVESRKAIERGDYARPHQNLGFAHLLLGELDDARREAQLAYDMARRQIAAGPLGARTCVGCPTEAKMPGECRVCLDKAKSTSHDIELPSGHYWVRMVSKDEMMFPAFFTAIGSNYRCDLCGSPESEAGEAPARNALLFRQQIRVDVRPVGVCLECFVLICSACSDRGRCPICGRMLFNPEYPPTRPTWFQPVRRMKWSRIFAR